MSDDPSGDLLATLRARAEAIVGTTEDRNALDELGRALHELDVHQAELELQNQSLQEAQAELAASRDRYATLFHRSPVPLVVCDGDGVIVDANDCLAGLVAAPRLLLLGKPVVVFLPAEAAEVYHSHRRRVLAARDTQRVELEIRTLPGGRRSTIVESSAYFEAGDRAAPRLLSAFVDVTDQRLAEEAKRTLEARLREGEKLEAIGRLAASIAHDVNNLLTVVMSTAESSLESLELDERPAPRDDLALIVETCGRGARLMRGLLGLARPPAPADGRVDLGALLARVAKLERRAGVEVEVVAPSHHGVFARGDEDQLVQVLVNLCANGVDAMSGRGKLVLACGEALLDSEAKEAWLSVTDAGAGMAPDVVARVFEPLFTTKRESGGNGLGLAIVDGIVRAHGGRVEVVSRVGSGTTMRVVLPSASGADASSSEQDTSLDLACTFLLVEDNDAVRAASQRLLDAAGARVAAFARGDEALDALAKGLDFEVALLDVDMPIMSGAELAQALIAARPDVRIVFLTGAEGNVPADILARRETRLLHKPWTKSDLARVVAELRPTA